MIKLLECTLRDGGYINDWNFGKSAIADIIEKLEKANVDIIELGFLKDEPYQENRTVFNDVEQITALISNKKPNINYAAMIEVVNPIPLPMVKERTEDSIDTIRVIVWKTKHDEKGNIVDALEEGYKYCEGIVKKGYNLCVQPARVDQYSDSEFVTMIKKFEQLNPMAIYIVDSWGTLNTDRIMHYVNLADMNLKANIAIGYHGHNNLMQAFGNATTFINSNINRDLIVDSSVYGIGRGAGNLNTEIFAKYLNETLEKKYEISPMIYVYEEYIKEIFKEHEWGYSIPYYLTAKYNCNPNYGEYYGIIKKISTIKIEEILKIIKDDDKILFTREKAEAYQKAYENGKK